MLKPTMLKQTVVRKDQEEQEEDRGLFTPVLMLLLLAHRLLEHRGLGHQERSLPTTARKRSRPG